MYNTKTGNVFFKISNLMRSGHCTAGGNIYDSSYRRGSDSAPSLGLDLGLLARGHPDKER